MKHSRWLLILVLVLMIINAVFFILWYALKGRERVTEALEGFLSKTLSGQVNIEKLSINERQITANGLSFADKKGIVKVSARQVQVRYNLLRIITSGFKFQKVVKSVTVYEPDLSLRIDLNQPRKEEKKKFEIPDLTPYFDKLEIKQGKLDIVVTGILGEVSPDTLRIEEKLSDIDITVVNKRNTSFKLDAITARNGKLQASAKLDKGLISEIKADISDFIPFSFIFTQFEKVETTINVHLDYSQASKDSYPEYTVNCNLAPTNIFYRDFNAIFPEIQIQANPQYVYFNVKEAGVNTHRFKGAGYLHDYLHEPYLNVEANIIRLDLNDITDIIEGSGAGVVKIEGNFDDLFAKGSINFPEIKLFDEYATDVNIDAEMSNLVARFSVDPFSWRNQLTSANGSFDINTVALEIDLMTSPVYYDEILNLSADVSALMNFKNGIKAQVEIRDLEIYNSEVAFSGFHGQAEYQMSNGNKQKGYVSLALENENISIRADGDPIGLDLEAELLMENVVLDNYLLLAKKQNIDAIVSGLIKAQIRQDDVSAETDLNLKMAAPKLLTGNFLSKLSYNLKTKEGDIDFHTQDAAAENIPFEFSLTAKLDEKQVQLLDFNLDNILSAQGWYDFEDYYDSGLILAVDSLDVSRYWKMFNPVAANLPDIGNISAALDYNLYQDRQIRGLVNVDSIQLPELKPLTAHITLTGTTDNLNLTSDFRTPDNKGISLQGNIKRGPGISIKAESELKDFSLAYFFIEQNFEGLISGNVAWNAENKDNNGWQQSLACNLTGTDIRIMDIPLDNVRIKATQENDVLLIDSLQIFTANQYDISGSGALNYNFLTSKYTEGSNSLSLNIEAEALKILQSFVPYFVTARGKVNSQLIIQTNEDGIEIVNGSISMENGLLKMQDQMEAFSDIDLSASILKNELKIDSFTCRVGNGRLFIRNEIDLGEDNFFIGPLNLGYFLIRSSDPGIQIPVPEFLPANTVATALVKGQNKSEATIKGPFDDMEIVAEVVASNGSAVYPANTKNLLQMINVFQRKPEAEKEILPLPFTLDLMIKIDNNVHYVTYPANLVILPGSFLRLSYDGIEWHAKEADFISEKGTLDFYGTIFQVEQVRLIINESNNIIAVNGTLTRKLPDGTQITLTVTTNPQKGPDILNQLEFNLTSDNPQDRTTTQILARLRYNKNIDELSAGQRQSLLQDEAMQLISTSVSTTYVSQFLSPVENRIRRFLKLDSFSISTGFVQNLFVEFTSNDNDGGAFSDAGSINADILQFSSSVLLNNL
ncbi:MAG: hypothetical protein R6V77_05120, partial [Candidatus Cloacimonadaceae bacterium]